MFTAMALQVTTRPRMESIKIWKEKKDGKENKEKKKSK